MKPIVLALLVLCQPALLSDSARQTDKTSSRFAPFDVHRAPDRSYGAGKEALVFVHGRMGNLNRWQKQLPAFEGTMRLLLLDLPAHGQSDKPQLNYSADSPARAVEQLRHINGDWAVTTEFLNGDGTVAKSVQGTYRFHWIVPDRVLSGQSEIPELKQTSGILFYINEKKRIIEMASVGADGNLWIMSGAANDETRTTQPFRSADGKLSQLRFTRYKVKPDSFESKMEYTTDGGKTWLPGNHQIFRRL